MERPYTEKSRLKLATTAQWIRDRISALPESTSRSVAAINPNVYTTVLLASRIYVCSIVTHAPLSESCSLETLNHIWGKIWRVSLTEWKATPGIFMWILLVLLQASRDQKHGRLVKSMLKATCYLISVGQAGENGQDEVGWGIVDSALDRWTGVTRWMREAQAGPGLL